LTLQTASAGQTDFLTGHRPPFLEQTMNITSIQFFNRKSTDGLNAAEKAQALRYMAARERVLNTIEVVSLTCQGGPMDGVKMELDAGSNGTAEISLKGQTGRYLREVADDGDAGLLVWSNEPAQIEQFIVGFSLPRIAKKIKPASDKAHGLTDKNSLLIELIGKLKTALPDVPRADMPLAWSKCLLISGPTDDFGNTCGEIEVTYSGVDDFGNVFRKEYPRSYWISDKTLSKHEQYKINRTTYTILATQQARENLIKKLLSVKKYMTDDALLGRSSAPKKRAAKPKKDKPIDEMAPTESSEKPMSMKIVNSHDLLKKEYQMCLKEATDHAARDKSGMAVIFDGANIKIMPARNLAEDCLFTQIYPHGTKVFRVLKIVCHDQKEMLELKTKQPESHVNTAQAAIENVAKSPVSKRVQAMRVNFAAKNHKGLGQRITCKRGLYEAWMWRNDNNEQVSKVSIMLYKSNMAKPAIWREFDTRREALAALRAWALCATAGKPIMTNPIALPKTPATAAPESCEAMPDMSHYQTLMRRLANTRARALQDHSPIAAHSWRITIRQIEREIEGECKFLGMPPPARNSDDQLLEALMA
jgi:hypothetical protein